MNLVFALGIILILGIFGGKIANSIGLPSVTGYLIIGIIIGPNGLGVVPKDALGELAPINDIALGIIAASIGAELSIRSLKRMGARIGKVFTGEALVTFILVSLSVYLVSKDMQYALVLGVLAMATAPAAIMSILKELKVDVSRSRTILALLALDNLICITLFGLLVGTITFININGTSSVLLPILYALGELFLSIAMGAVAAFILIMIIKTKVEDNNLFVLTIGMIFFIVGAAESIGLSSLLAAMAFGATLVNLLPNPIRIFSMVQNIEMPIFVAFLTIAGQKLDIATVGTIGVVGLVYVVARTLGKIVGAKIGCLFLQEKTCFIQNIGLCLTPQAGVAIGLSVIAEQKIPALDSRVVPLILGAVIIFEIVGPILVKRVVSMDGSVKKGA